MARFLRFAWNLAKKASLWDFVTVESWKSIKSLYFIENFMDCFVSPYGLPRKDGKGGVIARQAVNFGVAIYCRIVIARLDEIKSWQSILWFNSMESLESFKDSAFSTLSPRRDSAFIFAGYRIAFFRKKGCTPSPLPYKPCQRLMWGESRTKNKQPLFLLRYARKPSARF